MDKTKRIPPCDCRARSPPGFAPKPKLVQAKPIDRLATTARSPNTTRGIAPYNHFVNGHHENPFGGCCSVVAAGW